MKNVLLAAALLAASTLSFNANADQVDYAACLYDNASYSQRAGFHAGMDGDTTSPTFQNFMMYVFSGGHDACQRGSGLPRSGTNVSAEQWGHVFLLMAIHAM